MTTIEELIHYCRQENPVGALILFGESGCGKTYLIEKELQEALKSTHFIVRVSLFGISSIQEMHSMVKRCWLFTVFPLLSKLGNDPEQVDKRNGLFKVFSSLLKLISPRAGDLVDSQRISSDDIVIYPVKEDYLTKEKKRVVLVFDDVDRTKLDWVELLGAINDYGENRGFNTIIVANREYFNDADSQNAEFLSEAKEKTIAYTVLHIPDYEKIVHDVIGSRSWKTEEYGQYLKEHEQMILELFGSKPLDLETHTSTLAKHHNIRSLITGLECFYRVFYYMKNAGIPEIDPYFISFLSYYLAIKGGIYRDRKTTYAPTDEEIRKLYPGFSADKMFESIRAWIRYGYWNKELIIKELSQPGAAAAT